MEKENVKKIKMPEPSKNEKINPKQIEKIYAKLDLLSKNETIRKWTGISLISFFFNIYLFDKYNQSCFLILEGSGLGLELNLWKLNKKDNLIYMEYF